jgi:hypothetical protein
MKQSRECAVHHVVFLLLIVGFITVKIGSQVSEAPKQDGTTPSRPLSSQEAKLLLDGIKKVYGVDPDMGKLNVAEGRKAESVFDSLLMTKAGSSGSTCSYPSKGDVVSGVVIAEDKNLIYVDAKPCELRLFSIRKPYTTTKIGSVTCKGKILDRYAITQH